MSRGSNDLPHRESVRHWDDSVLVEELAPKRASGENQNMSR